MPVAFIAGATGLTGRSVVQFLRDAKVDVVAHIRPDSKRLDEWTDRFEALGATVSTAEWTVDAMSAAFQTIKPDMVFALLGTTKKRSRAGDGDYDSVDYALTALLIESAEMAAASSRFIYLSAVGVTPTTRNRYLSARAKVEARLAQSPLAHCIARPSFILGQRDDKRPLEALGAPLLDGLLATMGLLGGRRWSDQYRSMPGTDLAMALTEAALAGLDGILDVPRIIAAKGRYQDRIANWDNESETN